MIQKLTLIILMFFSAFGILFISILGHEAFHVAHASGAKSVCLDFNLKFNNDEVQKGYLTAHTVFEPEKQWNNVEEFYSWREYSEKLAGIFEYIFLIIFAIMIGLFAGKGLASKLQST